MTQHALLLMALLLPLSGLLAQLILPLPRQWRGPLASCFVAASFIIFVTFLVQGMPQEPLVYFEWMGLPGYASIPFSLTLDQLSMLMCLIITGIGTLIHVYAIGYMSEEECTGRFFGSLNFFVFAMLTLVLGSNLLVLFLGWEGVGLASYLLIGFDYYRKSAAKAAIKAMVVNRIGDLGFLLAAFICLNFLGTVDIPGIVASVGTVDPDILLAITLLFFVGCCGKSAQLPLYTWLPDAMEGPTPVSALIHAATMVTAGIYLIVRMHPLFSACPDVMLLIGTIGAATSLFAAFCATAQTDLKRVLAYSTVSQLGLMFLACGVGAYYAAMFHLLTHAFIKALLFLTAGNVLHGTHETDMTRMGGLRKYMPVSNALFLIGTLAMAGLPPLAAFFSKDMLLEHASHEGFKVLYAVGLCTSLLTAYYLTRAYCLTFLGSNRGEHHIHEAPLSMIAPLFVLALGSLFGGFLGYWFGGLPVLYKLLAPIGICPEAPEGHLEFSFTSPATLGAIAIALTGVLTAFFIFSKDKAPTLSVQLFKNAFYVDQIYDFVFVRPMQGLGLILKEAIEPVLSLAITGAGMGAQGVARVLQITQSGQIRSYTACMLLALAGCIAYLVINTAA